MCRSGRRALARLKCRTIFIPGFTGFRITRQHLLSPSSLSTAQQHVDSDLGCFEIEITFESSTVIGIENVLYFTNQFGSASLRKFLKKTLLPGYLASDIIQWRLVDYHARWIHHREQWLGPRSRLFSAPTKELGEGLLPYAQVFGLVRIHCDASMYRHAG